MGGSAKIKLSYCLLSRVFGNRFSKDLGPRLVTIFSSSRGSEATSKAIGIKYTFDEGSRSNNNLPLNFPILGGFYTRFEAVLGSNWSSESTSRAMIIKNGFGSPVGGIREGASHASSPFG